MQIISEKPLGAVKPKLLLGGGSICAAVLARSSHPRRRVQFDK